MFNKKFKFDVKYNSTSPTKEIIINDDSSTYVSDTTINGNFKNHTVQIFRSKGSNGFYYFVGRLYYLKIYDNNVLVRYLIPCYQKSDNVTGLYDTVEGVFYANDGTGTLNKGDNINSEYVTSSTQMITNDNHTLYAILENE